MKGVMEGEGRGKWVALCEVGWMDDFVFVFSFGLLNPKD